MVILGKRERDKFEMQRKLFSKEVQTLYDEATTYHDGKWIMFELRDTGLFSDIERLLQIKRRPNRKWYTGTGLLCHNAPCPRAPN